MIGIGALKARREPGQPPIHLQTDWRAVACQKNAVRGEMHADRSPGEITCHKCRRVLRTQGYDLVALDMPWAERTGRI